MRITGYMTFWLCAGAFMIPLPSPAQQPSTPAASSATAPATQGTGTGQSQPAATTPTAVPTNPKTGLPYTPQELREMEIDKFDPMKKNPDTTSSQQNITPLTDRKQPMTVADPASKAAPPTGSIAAEQAAASAKKTPTAAAAQGIGGGSSQDSDTPEEGDSSYSGPAVLTRSYTLARPMDMVPIKWAGSLGFSYSWDDGQAPAQVNGASGFVSAKASAASINWNLGGRHRWKRDQIGLSYAGNYSEYFAKSAFSNLTGENNSLSLDYSHVFSRRLQFSLVESAQDLSQNYPLENPALQPGSNVANINISTSPNIQLLNNTVHQSSTQASVTYRQTARLSFDGTASYFIVGETQAGLTGMTGHQFNGDMNYRWTSRTTVGAYYGYTDYDYSHDVSHATSNGAGLIYSYAINRHTQFRSRLGISQISSRAYQIITLPPALAFILGRSISLVNASSSFSTTDISAQLIRDFGKSRTASVGFARGESPGNGLLLTSIEDTATAGYSTSLFRRRVPINVGASYTSLSATLQANVGNVKSETIYFGTSRPLAHNVSSSFRINYSRYSVNGTQLQQHDLTLSIGLGWSPRLDRVLPF
jgi:hypothetical protein